MSVPSAIARKRKALEHDMRDEIALVTTDD